MRLFSTLRPSLALATIVLFALVSGCGADDTDTDKPAETDVGVATDVATDAGSQLDSGASDAATADTTTVADTTVADTAAAKDTTVATDAGPADVPSADVPSADVPNADATTTDATTTDAGTTDAASTDGGAGDATNADASTGDVATDAGPPPVVDCLSATDCAKDKACQLDKCGVKGVCVNKPVNCGTANDPQCGCDGVTYPSGCNRLIAGVGLKSKGACPVVGPTKCKTGTNTCAKGEFCVAKACGAAVDGLCEKIPAKCAAASVCGCNGTTYDSSCAAYTAGQNVWTSGSCPTCKAGDACGGGWCPLAKGACGSQSSCAAKPTGVCPTVAKPVCGCDAKTYTSACKATAAGIAVDYDGICIVPCKAGDAAKACKAAEFCKLPLNKCTDTGQCAPKPADCKGATAKTVCGCDGKDYTSTCAASLAGVALVLETSCPTGKACLNDSECDDKDDCTTNTCVVGKCSTNKAAGCCEVGKTGECGNNEYCKSTAAGHCSGAGACEQMPMICAKIYKPVCGCDGANYGNACDAAGKGINVKSNGNCGP